MFDVTRRVLLILLVFVTSCLVGPALDQIHVVSGALTYAHPWFLDQAWWVGPQFGLAFAGVAALTLVIQHWFGADDPPVTRPVRAGQQLAWLLAAYGATGLFWREPWLLTAGLLVGLLVRVAYERPDVATMRLIVVLALAGASYEALLSSVPGTFSYTVTNGAPVPPWLPLLYAHAAPLVRTFMKNATVQLRRTPA
jgi:hypothetical protein